MDQLSAHLERGWELIEKADFAGAENCAERALALQADSPEAIVLLGEARNGQGDPEGAVEHFERAFEIDPDFGDAAARAAETYLCALGDYDRAIELCDAAIDTLEDPTDAVLLKADAELCKGEAKAARRTLKSLGELSELEQHLHAGRLWLDVGEPGRARKHLEKVTAEDPEDGDAWHALGCVFERQGELGEMIRCWKKVRELDLKTPRPPWAITEAEFEKIADKALREIPPRARELLQNVPIMIADYPTVEIIADGMDPRMMGFFSGVPYPDKSNIAGQAPHLDCIFLYQRNIERESPTREVMLDEIRTTVLHETGHFFGLDDDELDEIGLG
jgi:predicted Zn-dependent protease with MMP-like domain/Tfp pilus assembly protein PilF